MVSCGTPLVPDFIFRDIDMFYIYLSNYLFIDTLDCVPCTGVWTGGGRTGIKVRAQRIRMEVITVNIIKQGSN